MAKIDDYTVELARSTDPAEIKSAVSALRTKFRGDRATQGNIMIAAAYATRSALVNETYSKSELSALWGPENKPKQMLDSIRGYNRLGIAAERLGVLPEKEGGPLWHDVEGAKGKRNVSVWSLLAGDGAAQISAVGQYIENGEPNKFSNDGVVKGRDGEPTLAGLLDLLTDYFTPTGEAIVGKQKVANEAKRKYNQMIALGMDVADPEAGSTEGTGSGAEGEGDGLTPSDERNPLARVTVGLKDVSQHVKMLEASDFATAYPLLAEFVALIDERTAHFEAAKQAVEKAKAKGRAPKKAS